MDPKRATDHEAQACEHVPSRVVGSEGVVAEVPGSKRASDDFVDVDHASEFTLVQTDEVSEMGGLTQPIQVGQKLLVSSWRRSQAAMQCSAPANGPQKFLLASPARSLEICRHGEMLEVDLSA